MRQLGGGAIEPETSKVTIGNKEYVFSYRKLDNILLGDMKSNIVNEHLKHIEILIGSDHGQGACHFPAKFVFKYDDRPTVELEWWLAEIMADLESYELFNKTIAEPLDAALLRMMESKLVASGKEPDGRILVQKETFDARFVTVGDEWDQAAYYVVPFRCFVSGDLAFFAMLLGKASSGQSCYVCDLTNGQWQEKDHCKGNAWTLDRLLETYQLINQAQPRAVKGVIRLPLLRTVGVDRFLPP